MVVNKTKTKTPPFRATKALISLGGLPREGGTPKPGKEVNVRGLPNITLYYMQSLLLETSDPRKRSAMGKALESYRHYLEPAWICSLHSTLSRKLTRRFLISKYLLGRLTPSEELVIISLSSDDIYLSNLLLWRRKNGTLNERTSKNQFLKQAWELAKRIRNGTNCILSAGKIWSPNQVLELRRIGVGYKDKGSLSSTLSWKDQIVSTEDVTALQDNVIFELGVFLSFSEYSTLGNLRLTSPNKDEKEKE